MINLFLISFCYYGDFAFFSKLMSQLSFTLLLFYVSFSLFLVFKKTPNSVLYFLGWVSYSIGLSILLLRNFKLLPYNFFTSHAQEVGTIIEVLFFSISLVNRARLKKEESVSYSAVSNMVSMLAHELKRPLKVAVTELKDLQCKFPDKERPLIDLTVAVVDSSFQRLIKLLNEFRFISKERSILIKNKINLVEIAKESSSRIRQDTQDFSGEISIVEKNIVIKGLKEDFLKVFDNLFENAIEAGGKNTSVKFDIKKNIFGTVFISISNTGSVIPKHMHREVFKMSVTTKSNGHGVGLTLCKKIVEDYGGSINVSSNFKENSTVFRIILQT